MTLLDYVFRVQRLLHDAQAEIWPVTPDLVLYVNLARDRVALDTLATRVLPIITLTANVDRYLFSQVQQAILTLTNPTIPSRGVGAIYNVNCVQNTSYQPPLK